MKVVTIIGARPQFIKAATVSRVIATREDISEVIVHTGQHYDANMSDVFFEELAIPRPDHHLGIGGCSHGQMTGRQLEAIEKVLLAEMPDMVLVYGDTNSTLAGALSAVKLHIPVAHIEAGLRSYNRRMPEEINRILTDHASDWLFAPTETAVANLRREGLPEERIALVGDVMYDATLFYRERARPPEWWDNIQVEPGQFILATVHRAENTDDPVRLSAILAGLAASEHPVIMPMHPRTRTKIDEFGLTLPDGIHAVPPVGYLDMNWLEAHSWMIATDSGGVQKEAYFHGKRCVTLREETEWVELVESGWNVLVGADFDNIFSGLRGSGSKISSPFYGDGDAAARIVKGLMGEV
ncbi:non-hydrolyzing UDP-N-acetylglucosamine 2-epimerase [Ectothiorhodospira variabilis]|uniref:non-hydrolyzing UDP-N-acetylglucosamine 2-epimerase n=1 Tax=Ectothiorhodospira variabilis TaxID=505694 RepID=UPI001EFBBFC8|nr:UDP-N-acetylglucosamine 2-epimerase (non-hydrolyzing) [Ectothiorhodospira variabilis]MCG5495458.1 UDP-N-acetylglucosamine 2-epimerase (non-hydrolyzing) [Ectothiorhodospira variabilis]MCG5505056.1 UDP-N-acetylglucosamine 2-epimerase (non-hydrolyzing) [Ectothiorhodospira variabilis]MCG5508213.1 UDP-N-acetylglucosamine 2-epimerase (non-hydrolyzing) [Ectothiorhodospira variabilis]